MFTKFTAVSLVAVLASFATSTSAAAIPRSLLKHFPLSPLAKHPLAVTRSLLSRSSDSSSSSDSSDGTYEAVLTFPTACLDICYWPEQYVLDCQDAPSCESLCAPAAFNASADCLTCLIDNGEAGQNSSTAEFAMGEIAGLCMAYGIYAYDYVEVSGTATTTASGSAMTTYTVSYTVPDATSTAAEGTPTYA